MPRATGSPEISTIIFAVGRGEYDRDLAKILHAIKTRREAIDRLGIIRPSVGDTVEIWDEPSPAPDIKIPAVILGQRLLVVGFRQDGYLRCRVEQNSQDLVKGRVLKIDSDWVYRIHFYT